MRPFGILLPNFSEMMAFECGGHVLDKLNPKEVIKLTSIFCSQYLLCLYNCSLVSTFFYLFLNCYYSIMDVQTVSWPFPQVLGPYVQGNLRKKLIMVAAALGTLAVWNAMKKRTLPSGRLFLEVDLRNKQLLWVIIAPINQSKGPFYLPKLTLPFFKK